MNDLRWIADLVGSEFHDSKLNAMGTAESQYNMPYYYGAEMRILKNPACVTLSDSRVFALSIKLYGQIIFNLPVFSFKNKK